MGEDMRINLLALFEEKGPDGRFRFTRQEAEDFIALLILSTGSQINQLPAPLLEMMRAFALRVGWSPSSSGGISLQQAIETYFLNQPPHPNLLKAFREWTSAAAGVTPTDPVFQIPVRG